MAEAVEVADSRYYRPADAARVLGWPDRRRVQRRFAPVTDPEIVKLVVRGAPTPGRPPTWVVDADDVDRVAAEERGRPPNLVGEETTHSGHYAAPEGCGATDRTQLDALRGRVVELEGAYGGALEHREQLLDEIEMLHRLGIAQVESQRALLNEMRSFSIANFPERSRGQRGQP